MMENIYRGYYLFETIKQSDAVGRRESVSERESFIKQGNLME